MRLLVLIAGLALYGASLFFPAILFKSDPRYNPKFGECADVVEDDVMCEAFTFGRDGSIICREENDPGKTYIDKQKILDYCKGWDVPMVGGHLGLVALMMGWVMVFSGMFAWIANPLMLLALIQSAIGMRRAAIFVSVSAVAFGLHSFALDKVTNPSGSRVEVVDRLGAGFYLWMGALVVLAAYCFLKKPDAARSPGNA